MAGAGLPDCAHGRALFSWYVLLLMALYVPAGWVVSRLRGWPRPDRKTGCKAVLYPALCAWGWAFGGCGLLLLFSGREALFPLAFTGFALLALSFLLASPSALFMLLTRGELQNRSGLIYGQFSLVWGLGAVLLTGCALFPDDAGTIALNWGIQLPKGYTVAYEADTGASFGGDGLRCHVFTWRDGSALEELLPWQEEDEEGIAMAKEMLAELEVPEENWPDFSACLSWHGNIREEDPRDQLTILYIPERTSLWVLELFV